jgi:hypothetical protein
MNLIMHKYFVRSCIFFSALSLCIPSFAQTNKADKIMAGFVNNVSNHLHEKVYVHTDRSYYFCGQILWFKAYVENAANNEPLSLSKVAYVEVLNSLHEPVLQAKIAIENGSGSGSFALPLSLASGNYELRAYTNWMKNDAADHYFRKVITIVNTTENLDPSLVKSSVKYDAGFFPEGGNLVNGINSVVGFKINDDSGKGIDGTGVIVDEASDTVAQFQTSKFGMGHFSFSPQKEKKYTAIITLSDSATFKKELPKALDNGYVMHLSDEGNDIQVSVAAANPTTQNIYLIAATNNRVDFSQETTLQNNQAVFTIKKTDLNAGIAQITLFTANRQPVCERLYFKRPANKLLINAKADKQNFNQRDLVNINLSTTDISGNTLPGNLSAAVYRLDSLHQPDNENIFTYLSLTSDLKGYIENPDYYFKNDDAQTNEALDNLLLTQGWRKFDNDLSTRKSSYLKFIPENRGHIVIGKVTNEITGKPAENVLVYLSVPGKRVQLYGCKSDAEGIVHFDLKDFYGDNEIVLQTNTTKDSIYRLEIFSPFSDKFSDDGLPVLHVSENDRDDLEASNLHMEISNAYHQNDLQELQPLQIDTTAFYHHPNKVYLLDNYTRFITIEEVMREYVMEVNVTRRDKEYHFNTFNEDGFELSDMQPTQKIFNEDPLILLDGVPVFDVKKILAYDPLKVQKLEVVTSKYYWGPIVSEGIVSYTTYKGNLPDYTLNPHDVILDYDGLQQQRIFYSPDYSSEKALQSRLPDFRDLLYWSPDVSTNKKGIGNISFFTGDAPGKYLVVLQGISANGNAGSASFILNVKK